MNRLDPNDPQERSELEKILDHQIEVAQSWEVRVVGRDEDGSLIKVADGKSSTKAAEFICGLIGLGPLKAGDEPVRMPPELQTEGRPILDIIADVYRHRLVSGQLSTNELARLTEIFVSADKTNLHLVLALLGKNVAGKTPEDIRRLINGDPKGAELEAPKEGQGNG